MNKDSAKSDRIESINILRFLAAISVMMYHYTFMFFHRGVSYLDYQPLRTLFHYGYLGVDLFFIISGFVIAMTAKGRSWKDFIISRAARLYPVMWFSASVTAIIFFVASISGIGEKSVSISTYLANLTLVPSLFHERMIDGSYWSLVVEIKFYFLIFLLVLFRMYRYLEPITIGFSFALFVATFFLNLPANNASYFAAGILFYSIYEKGVSNIRAVTIFLLCTISMHYASSHASELSQGYRTIFNPNAISLYIASFYTIFTLISLKLVSFKQKKIYGVLGAVTYPVYLLHQEFGRIFFKFSEMVSIPAWFALLFQVSIIGILALLVVTYLEKRVQLKIKAALAYILKK